MPWTLYRYILKDLLRIIGLTTAVLVTIIAFGATIKPLASDALLDAAQTAKYLGLIIVPMLQFALPFAAGFGATLSFFRLTTDNEIQAMAASGISYFRMLLPVAGLGVALTILMIVLTQWVIPVFWTMIVQTAATDVIKFFQVSVERGEPFQIGRLQIYADRLAMKDHPEGPDGPTSRMVLNKVAAAELDKDGRIVTDVTAARAVVDVYRLHGQSYLKMVMEDAVALNAESGNLVQSARIAPPRAIVVPTKLKDNPKALTRTQMMELRENPDDYGKVAQAKDALVDTIREVRIRQSIDAQLRTNGQLELFGEDVGNLPRRVVVNATRLSNDGKFHVDGKKPIEIVQFDGGIATVRFLADAAELDAAASPTLGTRSFDLVLGEHEVFDLTHPDSAANKRGRLVIPNLSVRDAQDDDLDQLTSKELIVRAEDKSLDRQRVRNSLTGLEHEIVVLNREIRARLTNRYALSVTAFLLLGLGTVLPMWRRDSLPLMTYVWAFVPSVLDLVMIAAGEQLLRDGKTLGYFVMWGGNGLMLLLLIYALRRVMRH